MIIGDLILNADCTQIVTELQTQLRLNDSPYLRKIKDIGANIQVQCPYHKMGQERKPSAGIRKTDGMFHCLACGETHTLPEMISYCFGKNDLFGEYGRKWLVKNFSTVQVEERKDVEISMERSNTANTNSILANRVTDKSKWVTEDELDTYRYYHSYWEERGITDDDTIELFDLGYDKRTNCITFPVRDERGHCVFVARRNVATKWFNYPKDVEKPLYGAYEFYITIDSRRIQFKNHLFVTESMIDCLLLWQAGHYAVALNGTGSESQFEQLRRMPLRHLILATDNDSAGQKARDVIRSKIKNKLITEIIFPDDIKDIGDLGKAKRFDDIRYISKWEVF